MVLLQLKAIQTKSWIISPSFTFLCAPHFTITRTRKRWRKCDDMLLGVTVHRRRICALLVCVKLAIVAVVYIFHYRNAAPDVKARIPLILEYTTWFGVGECSSRR